MEVELFQKVGLYSRRYPVAEQRAMWNDDSSAPTPGALQPPHDQLQEQQRCLGRAPILWEVVEGSCFFFAAEGWVGQDDVDALFLADFRQPEPQGVARVDAWGMQAMQQKVKLCQ